MKNHIKRIATPKSWIVPRGDATFIVRPHAGTHTLSRGLALGVVLRDTLKLAPTMGEIKKMLSRQEILVDGRRRVDHRFMIGLFDVISIPVLQQYYRVVLDVKGRLTLVGISSAESLVKPCKVVGKKLLSERKMQFNLYGGINIISSEKASVGDTFVLQLPSFEVKKVFSLKPGMMVFLTEGKHAGAIGTLVQLRGDEAVYECAGENIETLRKYLFVLGEDAKTVVTR